MANTLTTRTLPFILRELVGEILYFPVWWYTQGLRLAWNRMLGQWLRAYDRLGIRWLVINMGKPMYGDYTRSGRVISFFIRLILIVWSLLLIFFWSIAVAGLFLLWPLTPIVAGAMLVRQLIPS